MRTDHDWMEDGCLECGTVHFRKSPLLGVCVDCFREETQHLHPEAPKQMEYSGGLS